MTIWEIASYGDVITLLQIFNAISVIFQNTGYEAAAVAVGIFVAAGMAIHNFVDGGKEVGLTKVLAGFIVFGMGFGTLTSVSIENRYDGTVTQIDNIPVAVAVPSSLISSVGLWITEKTEIAFSNVGAQRITTDGYLSPLKVIANLRRATYADSCPSGMVASSGAYNLCYSMRNYMADCAAVKANRDNQSLELQKNDIVTAMEFNSSAYATELVKADKTVESLSCSAAYNKIVNDLTATETDRLNAIGALIGTRTGESGLDSVKNAMQAIAADSSKATNFANSIYLAQPAEGGTIDYFMKIGAADIAENYATSIQQRNYEWSLQGDMFLNIMDKALSLFEAIIYAIAPFIGLMVLTGAVGMKSLLLYCQMILVIQFMPPMLVVVQNIVLADMASYQKSLLAQGLVVGSLDYMIALTKKANELMGLGGMMATTVVPALAMSLATGSGMAMMGAMRGLAAPPKDTDAVPNSATQGGTQDFGKLNNSALNRYGDAWTESNKDSVVGVASASDWKSQIDEKHSRAIEAESSYKNTRSEVAQSMNNSNFSTQEMASMAATQASSTVDSKNWTASAAQSLTDSNQISAQNASTVAGHIGLAARLGMDMFNANGELKEQFSEGLSSNEIQNLQSMNQTGELASLQQSFTDQVVANSSESKSLTVGNQTIDGEMSKVDDAYEEAKTAKEEYSASVTTMRGIKAEDSDIEGIYHRLGEDRAMKQEHDRLYDSFNDIEREQYAASMEELSIRMDEDTAKMVALSSTLKDANRSDDFFDAVTRSGVFSTPEISTDHLDQKSGNYGATLNTSGSNVSTSEPSTKIDSKVPTKSEVNQFDEENRAIVRQNQEAQEQNLPEQGLALQNENAAIIQQGREDIAGTDVFAGNMAHGMKELMSYLNGNLSDENIAKGYQNFKEWIGADLIPNPVRDAEQAYFDSDVGKIHLNISGFDTSQPISEEEMTQKVNELFDDKISYHQRMIEQNSQPLSDAYLSDDTKDYYRQKIAEHSELRDKLEAERVKFDNGEAFNTDVQLDKDTEWHKDKMELSQKLAKVESLGQQLEQKRASGDIGGNTENAKKNFDRFIDENHREADFLKQQISNIDNNLPYQMEKGSTLINNGKADSTAEIPLTEEHDGNRINTSSPLAVNEEDQALHRQILTQGIESAKYDNQKSFYSLNRDALDNGQAYSINPLTSQQYVSK
ncbi:conjugal transfer protein TraG N-terminal domain-containing protein [Vibrio mediterranei]|uniref:conjugal transfer protein TraG N-terminal domain-containing protein n=1 Tax=Vibrio mediterranei TaxID=689 RepID=UPI004067E441